MGNKIEIGTTTPEYPFGYGYCQCGCGSLTLRLSTGRAKYISEHHPLRVKRNKYLNHRGKAKIIQEHPPSISDLDRLNQEWMSKLKMESRHAPDAKEPAAMICKSQLPFFSSSPSVIEPLDSALEKDGVNRVSMKIETVSSAINNDRLIDMYAELNKKHQQLVNRSVMLESELEFTIKYLKSFWEGSFDAREILLQRIESALK